MATPSAIDAVTWTSDLLASLERADTSNQHALQIIGHDPVIATRFRAGEAAAAVLAANATAAADLWCARGGRPQRIEVDVRAAAASLVSFAYLRYKGASFDRSGNATTALYRARDGRWVHLHGGFSSREGTLALLKCDDDASAIANAMGMPMAKKRHMLRRRTAISIGLPCWKRNAIRKGREDRRRSSAAVRWSAVRSRTAASWRR